MCGIYGIADLDGLPRERLWSIQRMDRALGHRGPDEGGSYSSKLAAIAMRRLSIIDVEHGSQPFQSEDGTVALVCNGEIYNHRELRRKLEHRGCRFRSGSDVETILHGYRHFGLDITGLLEGMFGFAIWDENDRRLVLARDPYGIKPLFYYQHQNTLLFASELRALAASGLIETEVDYISLQQYLTYNYVPCPRSILKNVKKVEPGTMLIFDHHGLRTVPFSSISFQQSESRPPLDPREVQQNFLDRFTSAVYRELDADVPVGVLLSGGLDSSAVCAIAAKKNPGVSTFSVKFEDPTFDESEHSRHVASELKTTHHELTVTEPKLLDIASRLGDLLDEPLADSSYLPTSLLMRFVREHGFKVVLGGDGGDELFAGYPTHRAHRAIELYEKFVPFYLRAQVLPKLVERLPVSLDYLSFDFKAKRFLQGRGVPFGVRHQLWMGAFAAAERNSVLHPDLRLSTVDPYEPVHRLMRECDARTHGNLALYLDMRLYLEGDILQKVDRSSMRASVEARVPFLNREVAQFVLSLPYNFKLKNFEPKYFLKRSMRGIVPEKIISRKKKGFNFALGKYMQGSFRTLIEDTLRQKHVTEQGFFSAAGMEGLLAEHRLGEVDHTTRLWNLFSFQVWHDSLRKGTLEGMSDLPKQAVHSGN